MSAAAHDTQSHDKRKLMVSVDVEAQPPRAYDNHLDRLIWGRFAGQSAGVGEMMEVADRHGVKLTFFLDYCELPMYGDSFADVAREIDSRGHDVQLHAHLNFLPEEFWSSRRLSPAGSLSDVAADQATAALEFICEEHSQIVNGSAVAFRGGGYRLNEAVLDALSTHGVLLDSSLNATRKYSHASLPITSQFRWDSGLFELPVSCVDRFRNLTHPLDFNFNAGVLGSVDRLVEYQDEFYGQLGDSAVAVLVMHSWSFLELDDAQKFNSIDFGMVDRFDEFLSQVAPEVEIVTAAELAQMASLGRLSFEGPVSARQAPLGLCDFKGTVPQLDSSRPEPTAPASRDSAAEPAAASHDASACPICGGPSDAEFEMGGRRCPTCGSLERQRAFAVAYRQSLRHRCDVRGKRLLIISPAASEARFFESLGIAGQTSVDIRPETQPDILADICDMTEFAGETQQLIFASYLMPMVHDHEAALSEIHRILTPSGHFISVEPVRAGQPTLEHDDPAAITRWYGLDAYREHRVGSFRNLGEEDYVADLSRKFAVTKFPAVDPITNATQLICLCERK